MSVPPSEQIEVTDPTHPLYGLRLPCLGVTKKQHLGRVCVVWLAPGVERLIPVAATSLGGLPRQPSPCRLSAPGVAAFLAVLASLDEVLEPPPGQEDAHGATPPAPPARPATPAADGRVAAAPAGAAPATGRGVGHPRAGAASAGPRGPRRAPAGGDACR